MEHYQKDVFFGLMNFFELLPVNLCKECWQYRDGFLVAQGGFRRFYQLQSSLENVVTLTYNDTQNHISVNFPKTQNSRKAEYAAFSVLNHPVRSLTQFSTNS